MGYRIPKYEFECPTCENVLTHPDPQADLYEVFACWKCGWQYELDQSEYEGCYPFVFYIWINKEVEI